MGLYRLFLLLASLTVVQIRSRSDSSPYSSKDLQLLKSFLQSKDPRLSEIPLKSPAFFNIGIPPSEVFTRSTYSFSVPVLSQSLVFTYISLDSSAFSLKQLPKLNFKYTSPISLEIIFSPSLPKLYSDYLLICTSTEFLIYLLEGSGKDSPYMLSPVSIDYFQGSYGVAEVRVFNPFSVPLQVALKSESKDIHIEKGTSVHGGTEGEMGTVRSFYVSQGEYFSSIEAVIRDVRYYLPVHVIVRNHGLEVPRKVSLGIVTGKMECPVEIWGKNTDRSAVQIVRVQSSSRRLQVSQSSKKVPGHSEQCVALLYFTPGPEGHFSAQIEVKTKDHIYVIEFTASVMYSVLELSNPWLTFNPHASVSYSLQFTNRLPHPIYIYEISSTSPSLVLGLLPDFPSRSAVSLQAQLSFTNRSSQFLQIESSIGLLRVPLAIEEPALGFARNYKTHYADIYGPVDLGHAAYESTVKLELALRNPNNFEVVIEMIESIHGSKMEMPNTNTVPPLSTINFAVAFKVERNVFNPVIFHTSIGSFAVTICLTAVSGFGKVKSIYFNDVVPGILKEQLIYFTNSFHVPVKILGISSKAEMLSFETMKDVVLADREQVIGKVKINYSRKEKLQMDWGKYLTYADARAWNQLQHSWEEGEKVGELVVSTDIAGDLNVSVFIGFKKPHLHIETWPKFDFCSTAQICTGFLKINNPLNVPIVVQLLVAPDSAMAELKKYDCFRPYKTHDFVDDEFENVNPSLEAAASRKECMVRSSEEITAIKVATERKPRKFRKEPDRDLGIIEKFWQSALWPLETSGKAVQLRGPQDVWEINQEFFIGGKNLAIIPPKSTKVMGPISFQPNTPGLHNLSLILRNNYTVIEAVTIQAEAGQAKLGFTKRNIYYLLGKEYILQRGSVRKELHKLNIDVSSEEVNRFKVGKHMMLSPVFIRGFELQNIGSVDVEVYGMVLEGYVCELDGYILHGCHKEFLLKPQEHSNIQISYAPSLAVRNHSVQLWVLTNIGALPFIVESKLPDDFNYDIFLCVWGEETLLFSIATSLALLALLFKYDYLHISVRFRAKSSREFSDIPVGRYFLRKYSQPMFLAQQENTVPSPEIIIVRETVSNIDISEVVQPVKNRKKVKIRRNLANAIVQKAEGSKNSKNLVQLPEVIANNKLLIEKKIRRNKADEPAPTPKEITKSTEPDEDFYIDSYKMHNVLFGGISDRESCGLGELTQDSDPLDNI